MASNASNVRAPAPVVALAGWLVPGSGYCLAGHRARGLTVGITIVSLFVLGLLIGGARVVELPPAGNGPINSLMQRPWFAGQILAGPIALVGGWLVKEPSFSHARVNEIGTLYAAVAGMLNLLAIIDSTYRAGRGGRP